MNHLRSRSFWNRVALGGLTYFLAILPMLIPILDLQTWSLPARGLPHSSNQEHSEIRGVWLTNVDSQVLFSRENLEMGVQRLSKLNFNTVYPTVWNWGYTLFPSQVGESVIGKSQGLYPDLNNQGRNEALEAAQSDRDMLKELIELAQLEQIAVIPWMEFGFMAPANSLLVQQHPDWVTQRVDGTQVKMEGTHPRVWLNPFHPEVRQFLIDLSLELAANYDVQGIQFDDHLGLPVEFGYDSYTVGLYQSEHDGSLPPQDATDPEWVKWRADKITQWVEILFHSLKQENPDLIFSLSPNPAEFAYDTYLQDWVTWERRGFIEELVIQVYRDKIQRYKYELNQPDLRRANEHIPVAIGILSGLKDRPVSIRHIQKQVNISRKRNFSGVSFFFYETLWVPGQESATERQHRFSQLFQSPLPRTTLEHFQS